jgi:RNA polymerase sigma-70 factor (ECF subfamily)
MVLRANKHGQSVQLNGHEPIVDHKSLSIVRLKDTQLTLLESTVEKLKAEQRDCIKQFYLEENSYSQVSERMGIDVKAVKSHIQNGKRNLRILLEQHKEFNGS